MGCKLCKIQPQDNPETVKKKKRRSKHRKRHGKHSRHHHHHHHHHHRQQQQQQQQEQQQQQQYRRKNQVAAVNESFNNDSIETEHEMHVISPTKNETVNEQSTTIDEFVDIEINDLEAFNQVFIQQRQKAINNTSYRSIIESWQPTFLQQLVEMIKIFSKGKSSVDHHWIIFYWIAYNISYDTTAYFSKNYDDQSADGIFRRRKGVCAGYANLYKYLCDQLQLTCEIVSGYAKGYGFDNREGAPSETDHAWNVVEIDHHWYLIESTWGAGYLDETKRFKRHLTAYYFLPRPDEMIYHHLPEDKKWQLLHTSIKMSQFMQMPKLRPNYFELNLELIQPRNQSIIQLEQNKPYALVIIKAPNDVHLISDLKLNDDKIDGGQRVVLDRKKRQYYLYFAPSKIGKHKITIYGKRGDAAVGTFDSVLDLALNIEQMPENPISYPKTWRCFDDFGLKILSPSRTHIIHLNNDKRFAQIVIQTPSNIELIGQLNNHNNETILYGDQVYYDREKDNWRCKFAPNENGLFDATILAKKKTDSGSYTSAVSFKINANHILLPPLTYPKTWQLFYDLDLRILHPIDQGIIVLHDKSSFAEIHIKTPAEISLLCQIRNDKNEEIHGGKQIYYDDEKDFWQCKFAPNKIGNFQALILAKKKSDSGYFTSAVEFKIVVKQLSTGPTCFLNTTQLFHDLKLTVLPPINSNKIILSETSSLVEICLKTPDDVALLGQLIDSNNQRIPNADQVYYDRHKNIWRCKFAPNHTGLFEAIILATKKSDAGVYSTAVTFQIEANHIRIPPLTFPHTWQSFYDFNLKIIAPQSSSSAVWSENASFAEILIQAPDDIQLSCQIQYDNIKIKNGSLAQYNHEKQLWQLLFAPEQTGPHELIVYAKRMNDSRSSSNAVVKFNLNVSTLRRPIKFPVIYTQFETTKCRIYTPLNGILKKRSFIPIHCIIPGAISIQIAIDSRTIQCEDYKDPILKQEITVGSEDVTIYARYNDNPHYTSLIKYSVE